MKAVYKFQFDCGRMGELTGLFIEEQENVDMLIKSGIEVYFGEVLGKHSEVYGPMEPQDIIFVSDSPEVVKVIEDYDLANGFNPFDYQVSSHTDDDELMDASVLDAVKILIERENGRR